MVTDKKQLGKILVIDDEPSTLKMLRFLLGAYGYRVFTAESGESGIEIFKSESPGIVLTDIRMPGMDGLEVLERLKELDPDVEVIVITGHGDMESAIQALQYQASDFINKPIQKEALDVALKRAHEKIEIKKRLRQYTVNLEEKVRKATHELTKTYRQLEAVYEITRSVAEISSLQEIMELVEEKICCAAGHKCHAIIVLDNLKEKVVARYGDRGVVITEDFILMIRSLKEPRILVEEEVSAILPGIRVPGSERIAAAPITKEQELSVGVVLVSVPAKDADEGLRVVSLLLAQVAGALKRAIIQEEHLCALREMLDGRWEFGNLVGKDKKMEEIYKFLMSVAESDATILIQGESGTGKELIARRVHELSRHSKGPFVVVNCAAYPQTLIETELFGHEKGAFTGAVRTRKGRFELAHGGTIFLDEIGELPLEAQVKLLRVLQFREFQRVGGEATIKVDVRVVAATSKNLREEMGRGSFREDLYYRLHVIPIQIPPLRERISDVPLLANHFLRKLNEKTSKQVSGIEPEVQNILVKYHWPGNVRELENVIEHAFVLAQGDTIAVRDLPVYLRENMKSRESGEATLEYVEKQHLLKVLEECGGNKHRAALKLGISRSTLYRKLERYGILK